MSKVVTLNSDRAGPESRRRRRQAALSVKGEQLSDREISGGSGVPRIHLVLDQENQGWVVGKIGKRLASLLPGYGFACSMSDEPDPDADVNHWLIYLQCWQAKFRDAGFYSGGYRLDSERSKHTVLVTHLDDPLKVHSLRELFDRGLDAAICLSSQTAHWLADRGFDGDRLSFVVPGVDESSSPRRVVVGITSRVYSDGRKREGLLLELARRMNLTDFHFEIYGRGWDAIVPQIEAAGATVRYEGETGDTAEDYRSLTERVRNFDYYLYTGLDEGSMGTLDAWACGIRTIVTPQGFHLDLPGGITHPFESANDLEAIFRGISRERQRLVERRTLLSWDRYARGHSEIWKSRLEGRRLPIEYSVGSGVPLDGLRSDGSLRRKAEFVLQTARSGMLSPYLASRKLQIRGLLSRVKRMLFTGSNVEAE